MFKELLTRNTRVKLVQIKYTQCEMGEEAYKLTVRADGMADQSLLRDLAARGEKDITFRERTVYWDAEKSKM